MTKFSDISANDQSEARISVAYNKNCHLSLMTSFVKRPLGESMFLLPKEEFNSRFSSKGLFCSVSIMLHRVLFRVQVQVRLFTLIIKNTRTYTIK